MMLRLELTMLKTTTMKKTTIPMTMKWGLLDVVLDL